MKITTTIKHQITRNSFTHIHRSRPGIFVFVFSLAVSIISSCLMLSNDPNSLIYYGDAVSHLVIAKRITDSVTPGIAQFGSIWLPMTHIMLLPFVTNSFLFQTGLAGTIVSGVSTAVTVVFLFRITRLHFQSNYYGYLACSLFILNASVIYMSVVPMMEAPFMMFFMMASYYALNWYVLNNTGNDIWLQYRSLLKCSIAVTLATLTRYEAWFFPLGLILMILIVLLFGKKELWKRKIEAFFFIAAQYSFIGILGWIIYNGLIFKNPLLFLTGPYSAQAQSLTRPYRQHLIMQPLNSLFTIFNVAVDMYGILVVILSIVGATVFLYMKRKTLLFSLLTLIMLGFPILLDLVSMIQGSGEIYKHVTTGWFNGRYLVFVAPLFAFSCTALVALAAASRKKILTGAFIFLVLSSYGFFMYFHPMQVGKTTALADGTILPYRGDSAYAIDVGNAIKHLYKGGRILDVTLSKSSPIIQLYSGIPLKAFVDINNRDYWQESTIQPWRHVDYLVMQKPIEHLSGLNINETQYYDPLTKVIVNWSKNFGPLTSPWQPVGDSLLSTIKIIYQNPDFLVLKNEKKDLVLEKLAESVNLPANIAVLGNDDILLAEKKTGVIHRIVNGHVLPEPLLDVDVATRGERGVLGMAVTKNVTENSTFVFLHYTQSAGKDGDDIGGYREPLGNRLYRYELVNNKLVHPKLLIDLPPGPHDVLAGGKVIVGADNAVYILFDAVNSSKKFIENQLQDNKPIINAQGGKINILESPVEMAKPIDMTSKIIKVDQEGSPLPNQSNGRFSNITEASRENYNQGIRNYFGMDFDPVTNTIWLLGNDMSGEHIKLIKSSSSILNPNSQNLYANKDADSEFIWDKNSAPAEMSFINSTKLGKQYQNDLIVGDMNNGNLYHFDLNQNRTSLVINGSITDDVANQEEELKKHVLLTGLGKITDIETADDGYLYFITEEDKPIKDVQEFGSSKGSIYRIKAPGY